LVETPLDSNLIATVDLEKLTVTTPNGEYGFHIESATREKLLNGWDDIQLTLSKADKIKEYEKGRRKSLPWRYN
jgi:3-isopropylmalate/(R)-2-methylmalate dehydratase small subunit